MFAEDDHPDTSGPEAPEEPTPARDGNVKDHPTRSRAATESNGSIADRTETEEDDGQHAMFFAVENGKSVTLAQLVKRGTPVEVKYKLSGKAIPNVSGGLMDPYLTSHLVVADCVMDDVDIQYIRDGNGTVEKVVQYVTLKPRVVQNALSEAGTVLIQEAVKARAASEAA